jgi:hypothetical protein
VNKTSVRTKQEVQVKLKGFMITLLWLTSSALFGQQPGNAPYMDPNLPPERDVLPLSRSVRKIAVTGPSADDPVTLLGNSMASHPSR